jgi:hypothetical protein
LDDSFPTDVWYELDDSFPTDVWNELDDSFTTDVWKELDNSFPTAVWNELDDSFPTAVWNIPNYSPESIGQFTHAQKCAGCIKMGLCKSESPLSKSTISEFEK